MKLFNLLKTYKIHVLITLLAILISIFVFYKFTEPFNFKAASSNAAAARRRQKQMGSALKAAAAARAASRGTSRATSNSSIDREIRDGERYLTQRDKDDIRRGRQRSMVELSRMPVNLRRRFAGPIEQELKKAKLKLIRKRKQEFDKKRKEQARRREQERLNKKAELIELEIRKAKERERREQEKRRVEAQRQQEEKRRQAERERNIIQADELAPIAPAFDSTVSNKINQSRPRLFHFWE